MIDPFTAYVRMAKVGREMQLNWLCGVETLWASQSVIEARTEKMREAISTPWQADVAELSRMVPEKFEAFGASASAIMSESAKLYSAWLTQVDRIAKVMTSGRAPSFNEATTIVAQTTEYFVSAFAGGARLARRAIAPVHNAATVNACRLS